MQWVDNMYFNTHSQTANPATGEASSMRTHAILVGIQLIGRVIRQGIPSVHHNHRVARVHSTPQRIRFTLHTREVHQYIGEDHDSLTIAAVSLKPTATQPLAVPSM